MTYITAIDLKTPISQEIQRNKELYGYIRFNLPSCVQHLGEQNEYKVNSLLERVSGELPNIMLLAL